ncbi:MAG TPA: biotin/lipoyl-binding protein [Saprospiraceae bacterium]|nr:biotin/lipoyl-binding protein [Saprospiraceae bacterium]
MSQPFVIKINENRSFDITPETLAQMDIVRLDENHWQLLEQGISYHIRLVAFDYANRKMQLAVNGEVFDVAIDDRYAQLIERMGLSKEVVIDVKDIKAPMPGLVLKINFKAGDHFQKGDPLLILEAMKMENVIKAPVDGTIVKVNVKEGESVEKGQVLMEL